MSVVAESSRHGQNPGAIDATCPSSVQPRDGACCAKLLPPAVVHVFTLVGGSGPCGLFFEAWFGRASGQQEGGAGERVEVGGR